MLRTLHAFRIQPFDKIRYLPRTENHKFGEMASEAIASSALERALYQSRRAAGLVFPLCTDFTGTPANASLL